MILLLFLPALPVRVLSPAFFLGFVPAMSWFARRRSRSRTSSAVLDNSGAAPERFTEPMPALRFPR